MDKIIEDNYRSIIKRGLITPDTTINDFISKLNEEINEFFYANLNETEQRSKEELADVILVCLNIARHYNWDIESELKKKIKINFKR